jgi:dTDP-4-amino-4,6-dideoxygalactose transaminase
VGRNCIPDFHDLERKIDGRTRAILAVHYFGFPCGIGEIREICDRHRLYLIEDCAHVLHGEIYGQPLGTFGEASVFSWRKFLPIYDGGELVLNHWDRKLTIDWKTEHFLFTLRVAKNLLERALPEAFASSLGAFRLPRPTSRALSQTSDNQKILAARALNVQPNSSSFDQAMVNFPISRLSRLMMKHCRLDGIIAKRRSNYSHLLGLIAKSRGIRPLFENLPAGVCPWVLPVFFEDMPNAHIPLRRMGIPAVSWGGVRHAALQSTEFPSADFLYENLVFLPIHQDLDLQDLDVVFQTAETIRAGVA